MGDGTAAVGQRAVGHHATESYCHCRYRHFSSEGDRKPLEDSEQRCGIIWHILRIPADLEWEKESRMTPVSEQLERWSRHEVLCKRLWQVSVCTGSRGEVWRITETYFWTSCI